MTSEIVRGGGNASREDGFTLGAVIVRASVSRDAYLAGRGYGGRDLLDYYLPTAPTRPRLSVVPDYGQHLPVDHRPLDVGAIVMGRRLFETALRRRLYAPPGIKVFVVTRTDALPSTKMADRWRDVAFLAGVIDQIIDAACLAAHGRDVVLPGGFLCGRAMDVGAVDLFQLDVLPVVLGGGTHLCGLHRDFNLSALDQQLPAHVAHQVTLSTRK